MYIFNSSQTHFGEGESPKLPVPRVSCPDAFHGTTLVNLRWFSPSATFAPLFTLRATSRPPPLLAPLRWSTDHPSRQSAKRPCSNIFRQTPRGMHKAIANGIGNALDAAPPLFLPPLSEGARAANETTDTRWQVSK